MVRAEQGGSVKRLTFAAIVVAVVFAPATAMAQLPIDPTAAPTRDTGGWVYGMTWLIVALAVLMTLVVLAGFLRWRPTWGSSEEGKGKGDTKPEEPSLAPAISKPEPVSVAADAAASASAVAIGEKPQPVEAGAVPVADTSAATATSGDVYQKTLDELLAKGVPPKVAEARAKTAAKKAGG